MKISLVVAMSENNAIGASGELMWSLPADMKRFREITMGHHVLMGRKTFESIPVRFRPLKGRTNIIVTRDKSFLAEGCVVVGSLEEGVNFAKESSEDELMVIGGGQIYEQMLSYSDCIYLTIVHHLFSDADTFFPIIGNDTGWKLTSSEFHHADDKNHYDLTFQVWNRI